jgi:uncharacterized protein (DUF934 family)
MPLIDRTGPIAERWTTGPQMQADAGHRLVPLGDLEAVLATRRNDQRIGVSLANTATLADVQRFLERVDLIAITFPSYADGRGFSLARRLRRSGFTGRLRATGPLIADQMAYVLACGFDEIDLPDALLARQASGQWQSAAKAFSAAYQRGYAGAGSILDQRRAMGEVE